MKTLGAIVFLVGLATLAFAFAAYSELSAAATSATPPMPDAMPLTRIVGPELFVPGPPAKKPSELASLVFTRLYIVAGVALLFLAFGVRLLLIPKNFDSQATQRAEAEEG